MQDLSKPVADQSLRNRAARSLDARVERALATTTGHLLIFGWMADEGAAAPAFEIRRNGGVLRAAPLSFLRHARSDVAAVHGAFSHDFGYAILARVADVGDGAPSLLCLSSSGRSCAIDMQTERMSERRLLEEVLTFLGGVQAHGGREVAIQGFLALGGREIIGDLNLRCQRQAAYVQQIERFGPECHGPSFMTVLFGAVEAAMFQPLLFAKAGVDFGEWVYTCNSPEQAEDLIRLARTASNLYDLPIRVVVLNGNAGFGGANNAAIQAASGDEIVLINPDVHPISAWSSLLNRAIRPAHFAKKLRGGLLFYDDDMLMHGGMYLDEDVFVAKGHRGIGVNEPCRLLRVEHYDKGVPFVVEDWAQERSVTAITGALMAFSRKAFESIGGFSSDFIYGHYEDADLCLRWADQIGPVAVDPDIRMVHLEGQGSKTRLPHFHGAAIVNRYIFDARNRHFFEAERSAAHVGSR